MRKGIVVGEGSPGRTGEGCQRLSPQSEGSQSCKASRVRMLNMLLRQMSLIWRGGKTPALNNGAVDSRWKTDLYTREREFDSPPAPLMRLVS